MPESLMFNVYGKPEPQGSVRAFMIGGRPRITSDNPKMKIFRSEMTRVAREAVREAGAEEPMFAKHEPVAVSFDFIFRKPESVSKKRTHCVVRPDADKLTRMACDALTGSVWHDDAQVVAIVARKLYGAVEGVRVRVERAAC